MPYLLFVDDDSNVLNINRNYFESRGFSVSVAQTADQALDHVKKYPVDCVVPVSYTHLTLPTTERV